MYNRFKKSIDRNESFIFCLEDRIPKDDIVRVIDAFVDSLDLSSLNFKVSTFQKGNKPYSPFHLLKLYLYGYHKNIRSSRKLEEQCISNVYFMWLVDGVTPNFRTISDFRKNNIDSMKLVFIEWNLFCKDKNILNNIQSQDGTKVKAVNSKDKNFTFSKLDDRIKNIKEHINDYLKQLDETDSNDLKDEINSSIKDLEDKLNLYTSYQEDMKNNGVTQKSLTDPESKLMRDNGKFSVSYNTQVCVDANSHIVTDFLVTNEPADFNSMNEICNNIKDTYGFETLTNVTDKGYNSRTDMMKCLEDGIIPEVTPDKDKDGFVLETEYEENEITDEIKNSIKKEDIKKCLRAGVIPTIYENNISSIEVKEVYIYKDDDTTIDEEMTEEQMRDKAMEEKIFVRDIENNKVFCPQGEILRPKSKHQGGIKYCNKLACKNCKNPCCKAEFKEVTFKPTQKYSYPNNTKKKNTRKNKRVKIKVKKVIITTKTNKELVKKRMSISEHSHASMKFWDNSRYMLLKGIRKVTGELSLYYCASNIRRAVKILGAEEIIKELKEKNVNNSYKKEYLSQKMLKILKLFKTIKKISKTRFIFFVYRTLSPEPFCQGGFF